MSPPTEARTGSRATFRRRLIGGFAIIVALTVLMGGASIAGMTAVIRSRDLVASASRHLSGSLEISVSVQRGLQHYRAFLLSGTSDYLQAYAADRQQFLDRVAALQAQLQGATERQLLDKVAGAEAALATALQPVLQAREKLTDLRAVTQLNSSAVRPARESLEDAVLALVLRLQAVSEEARRASSTTAKTAIVVMGGLCGLAVISAVLISAWLSSRLRREIGAAAARIQSSSDRLEAAADPPSTGGPHQLGGMQEVTATISELLMASQLIAANARQVADVTDKSIQEAAAGGATLDQTRASIAQIREQVSRIVTRMLALQQSQESSGIKGLVSELTEQINILAVNARTDACGEQGRTIVVLGDKIYELAETTAQSARLVRALIKDMRDAVSTTVSATDAGKQAVDTAAQQCGHVAESLQRIATLISAAREAGLEIEMSAKKQTSAVEKINMVAGEAARATRKTEADAVEARKTASELSSLSRDLRQIVGATF